MSNLTNFSKLLLISVCILYVSCDKVYKCEISEDTCVFSNIKLTSINYNWIPEADEPNNVTIVEFTGSKIPIITKNICDYFPNLRELWLEELSIKEVKEDAFHSCSALTRLFLYGNLIEHLHPQTFWYMKKLKTLSLHTNRIGTLDDYQIFSNLGALYELDIGNNNLTTISPELFRHNWKLRALGLYANDLSDFEVEVILSYLPLLRALFLDDNEISCTRMVEIILLLKSKNIYFYDLEAKLKIRYYPQQTVFNINCNPDISWMASQYRKENSLVKQRSIKMIEASSDDSNVCESTFQKKTDENFDRLTQEIKNDGTRLAKIEEKLSKLEENVQKIVVLLSNIHNF